MKYKHAVIYIPGLGDTKADGQRLAVGAWRWQGVEPHFFHAQWANGELLAAKMERLLTLIDHLHGKGKRVSLLGASAGGSLLINAYAARREVVHGAVCLCGKIRSYHNVHPMTYQQNPAFDESMRQLEQSFEQLDTTRRARILSLHPLYDPVVPIGDTRVPGVRQGLLPVVGHFFGIAYGLTLGSFRAIRFLKRLPNC